MNPPPTFYPGQVVKLKSGGPRMTVAGADSPQNMGKVLCMWFHADSLSQSGYFDPATLVPENPFPSVPPQQPGPLNSNTLCTNHFWPHDHTFTKRIASELQTVINRLGCPLTIKWLPELDTSDGCFEVSAPIKP